MSIIEESLYRLADNRLNEATLSAEEKMEQWHNGQRRENIKACSDKKLIDYYKICIDKGYIKEGVIIADELKARGYLNSITAVDWWEKPNQETTKSQLNVRKYHSDNRGDYICIEANEAGVDLLKKRINIEKLRIHKLFSDNKDYFILEETTTNIEAICNDLLKVLNKD